MRVHRLAAACVLIAACSGGEGDSHDDDPKLERDAGSGGEVSSTVEYLSPTQHLVRASMALRGIRPSLEELAAVRKNPKYVAAIVDYYLESPELAATVRELHAEALLVGVDPVIYPAGFPSHGELEGMSTQQVNQSIVDAPLKLIEHVITNDRPYGEIVTADYTLADRTVATVWGMPYDANGETWQQTKYDDGRPTAGILSDSFLFTRHSTTYSNKSRGRANMISRALLCYDFLSRDLPIDTSIDLADSDAVTDAVKNNPTCAACHNTLDPLAAYFAPFRPIYVPSQLERFPYVTYVESFREAFSVTEPGFFGEAGKDVRDLGRAIAKDPQFSLCAAKRFYSFLAQVELNDVPSELAERLRDVLEDHDMNAKQLLRAVVLSDEFRVQSAKQDDAAETLVGLKKATPEAYARMVEDLTGYRWQTSLAFEINDGDQVGDVDLMTDAFFGFKVLSGGIDGNSVTRPSHTMSATVALSFEGLAARASKRVVEQDLANANKKQRRLLTSIDESDTSESAVREQLAALELRLFGEKLATDSPEIDAAYTLFAGVLKKSQARRAWMLTLYALLQDPRMVYY